MKKLTKADELARSALLERLNKAEREIDEAMVKIVAAVEEANTSIAAYNEVLSDIGEFRDELVDRMTSYKDDRSEKWQESDAGSNYQSWVDEWENFSAEELAEIDQPEAPEITAAADLEALPGEVE